MKFHFDHTEINTDEKPFSSEGLRGLYAAFPGHGKSHTAAIFVEQWLDQNGTVVIFEPLAEWHTLKQKYPVQVVGGPHAQDIPFVESEPELYAKAVVEKGISMVFYTRDVRDQEKLVDFVCKFIDTVMRLQELHHRPLMILLEEAHEYAPVSAKGQIAPPWVYNRMIKALVDCYTQGRKLNIVPISITQRPQVLNFTIRQLCNFVWFGKFSAQDAKYIDKEVLKSFRERGHDINSNDLIGLERSEWFLIAGEQTKRILVTDRRKTPHGADTPKLDYVAPVDSNTKAAVSSLGETLKEMIQKRGEEQSDLEKAKNRIKYLEEKEEDLKKKVQLGVDLRDLLKPGAAPDQAEVADKIREIETKHQAEITEFKETWTSPEETEEIKKHLAELEEKTTALDLLAEVFTPIIEPIVKKLMPAEVPSGLTEKDVAQMIKKELDSAPKSRRTARVVGDTGIAWIDMWLPKLGTAEQKIIRYMASRFPLKMTKSQISIGIALSAKGGYFNGAFNNLVKKKLIAPMGGDNFALAEAPP